MFKPLSGKYVRGAIGRLLLLAFIVALTLALASCESAEDKLLRETTETFNAEVSSINSLQSRLSSLISDAEGIVSNTTADELAADSDIALLDDVRSALEPARSVSVDIPDISASVSEINQQTAALAEQKRPLQEKYDSLSTAVEAVRQSKRTKTQQIATEKQAALEAAVSPSNVFTGTYTDANGYTIEATLKIGSWLKATDTASLERAWQLVGGQGSVPELSEFNQAYNLDGTDSNVFLSGQSVLLFGCISFKNLTQGFDISADNTLSARAGVSFISLHVPVRNMVCYSNKRELSGLDFWYRGHDMALVSVSANMTGNNWGPVPIVIAAGNVFNPNNPDGVPELTTSTFYYNLGGDDGEFTLSKSW